jgi:hypothetical protein
MNDEKDQFQLYSQSSAAQNGETETRNSGGRMLNPRNDLWSSDGRLLGAGELPARAGGPAQVARQSCREKKCLARAGRAILRSREHTPGHRMPLRSGTQGSVGELQFFFLFLF